MKKFLIIFVALPAGLQAQVPSTPPNNGIMSVPAAIFFTDVGGKQQVAEFNYSDVKGTPFYKANWGECTITLAGNRVYEKVTARFNLNTNVVHYLSAKQEELVAPPLLLREIKFYDTTESGITLHTFSNGYPAVDNNTGETYYEVLSNGKAQLLLMAKKKLLERKAGIGMAAAEKEFLKVETYYVFKDGQIKPLKKDKAFLTEWLGDKQQAISDYISTNNLKCKSVADIKQVIDHYNTL